MNCGDRYKYVSLNVWCPGHVKSECIAFPELLVDDEIRLRCSGRVNAFIRKHAKARIDCKDSRGWEDFVLQSGCKVSFVSRAVWESNQGHIW